MIPKLKSPFQQKIQQNNCSSYIAKIAGEVRKFAKRNFLSNDVMNSNSVTNHFAVINRDRVNFTLLNYVLSVNAYFFMLLNWGKIK